MGGAAARRHGEILREVVAYGALHLNMTDAAIAQELAISRERVRQLRGDIPRRTCPGCGRRSQGERDICAKCYRKTPEGRAENIATVRRHYKRKARAEMQPLLERAQRAVWELNQLHPHSSLDQLLVDLQDAIGQPRSEEG